MIQLLPLTAINFVLLLNFSHAMDEVPNSQEVGARHADLCVQQCNDYYNKKNNLEGFDYYRAFVKLSEALDKLTNMVDASNSDHKQKYCNGAHESIKKCYQQDSNVYSVCKWVGKWATSKVTSDPIWVDKFSSCKDKCFEALNKLCSPAF